MTMRWLVYLCILALMTSATVAQQYLPKGSIFGGARIGLSAKENAFNIGVDGEYTLTGKDEAGPGIVNLCVSLDYSRIVKNVTQGNISGTQTTTYVPITLGGTYHFSPSIEDTPEFDPYLLAGFAYRIQTVSADIGFGATDSRSNNDVMLVGGLGAWYFFSPQLAGHIRIAFNASFLTAGIMYRFY
ncbi:MAG: outer membrane beta-barrel protein [Chlorobi bacterium]|nr:outer membrane beta-barrel protein [Chlorobiota bacterium]